MFKLVKRPAQWWPVVVQVPADGGRVEEERLDLKFKRLSIDEFNASWGTSPDRSDREAWRKWNRARFDQCVADWRGVAGEDEKPVEMTSSAIDEALNTPGFPEAFGTAYLEFWRALPATIAGNSETSLAGGPATGDGATAGAKEPAAA